MARSRVLRTSAAVLSHQFEVGETPTDSGSTVTVAVTDANSTAVTSGNASSAGVGTGSYLFALPGQSALKQLDVAWSASILATSVVQVDDVEIVGGFFFSLAQGRASDASLADTVKYPTTDLDAARLQTEEECELICDRTFVPRYARVVVDGSGETDLLLPHPDPDRTVEGAGVRTIRRVSMAPRADETFVDFTTAEKAALKVTDDGLLQRLDGNSFTAGFKNVVVEYEYGWDSPPAELVQATLTRFRSRLNMNKSAVPDRASSFTANAGGTYRLTLPTAYSTGIPAVDAVYARYARRDGVGPGGAADKRKVPASRQLNYDPQYGSMFHGGRR